MASISSGLRVSGTFRGVVAYVTILSDFSQRSSIKLEYLGDTALDSKRHDEAVSHYTTALSLDLPSPRGILIKRGKAFMATGSLEQALDDANQVHHFSLMVNIVDPSCSGDHARSVVAIGLRSEACSFT